MIATVSNPDKALKTSPEVLATEVGHLGILTLNRPQALNALNLSMIEGMQAKLIEWESDPKIHAVIVQSNSPKAFCAGGDVRWLYDHQDRRNDQLAFFWQEYQLNYHIHTYKKPYIAIMDGITMGGGVGIALHASHPIATERFSFAMPETSIGFFPDIGASYLLSRCPHSQGIYLGLTGERLTAEEARARGLLNYQVDSNQLENLITTLTDIDLSADAHATISKHLLAFMKMDTQEKTLEEAKALVGSKTMDKKAISKDKALAAEEAKKQAWIASCFSNESVEAIIEALKQSSDTPNPMQAAWAQKTLTTLAQKSPTSLKITLEQIQRAQGLSLAECLNMDYILAQHFMKSGDFYEGVRSLLVDKDKSPKWKPPRLEVINKTEVASYFQCRMDGEAAPQQLPIRTNLS